MVIPVLTMLLVPNVYAGGARMDWSDEYDMIGEKEGRKATDCWINGYDDGLDHPFDQHRHKECQFDIPKEASGVGKGRLGQPYYEAFIYGCMDVEGNTEEICERFTD